jgi:DNA-binding protein HU-beta
MGLEVVSGGSYDFRPAAHLFASLSIGRSLGPENSNLHPRLFFRSDPRLHIEGIIVSANQKHVLSKRSLHLDPRNLEEGFQLFPGRVDTPVWSGVSLRLQPRFLEIVRFCCHKPGLKMTKTELQIALAAATQTNKRTAGVFLDTLSSLAYKAIKKNGEFVLPGFGKLVKQKRKARTGFNPKTQQKIKIPAKTVVKFRVGKVAKDAILGVKK